MRAAVGTRRKDCTSGNIGVAGPILSLALLSSVESIQGLALFIVKNATDNRDASRLSGEREQHLRYIKTTENVQLLVCDAPSMDPRQCDAGTLRATGAGAEEVFR